MKISKHIHSCLLVQEQGKVVLVDPGNYSYEEKALDIHRLNQLDAIVITHEHPDHMYIPWIKEILTKFPHTPIVTTESAVKLLQEEGISATSEENEFIQLEPVPHERIWVGNPVQNVKATLFGTLTTPGDSHTFHGTANILALPVQAPWGSTTRAVELALELKPKVIIPVHDWMWKDGFRKSMYQRLKDFLATQGIDFKAVETGDVVEV